MPDDGVRCGGEDVTDIDSTRMTSTDVLSRVEQRLRDAATARPEVSRRRSRRGLGPGTGSRRRLP